MLSASTTRADHLALARDYARRPIDWPPAPRFDPVQRWYHRLATAEDHEAWLLTWLPGQGTDLHDHGESAGAFAVVAGELTERTLQGQTIASQRFDAGRRRAFGRYHVHQIVNNSDRPAVSVHVYGPALSTMTRYRLESGRLRASLQDLGLHAATDVVGGYLAWYEAGLPVIEGQPS